MKAEDVDACLADLDYEPLTSPIAGRLLHEVVLSSRAEDVLELGFGHGTSTMYLAAALDELGAGRVTTIDREVARARQPNVLELAKHLGLESRLEVIFAPRSYNWELMTLIERQTRESQAEPCFDLCFIDGAHTWYDDGFAFFLVDKLLREDRWIVFDDVHWTHVGSPSIDPEKLDRLPEQERVSAQVLEVFNLLVRQHPSYGRFRVLGNYAAAYKRAATGWGDRQDVFDLVSPELTHELAFGELRRAHGRTILGAPNHA